VKELNTIGRYWRKKYNQKVYKIPISIPGFTCPNIDGTVAYGGCTFCENDSFAPNLKQTKAIKTFKLNPNTKKNDLLPLQLEQLIMQYNTTKIKLQKKFNAQKFIIYFQSFTNTYAPFDTLKALYEKALSFEDVVGLSIGTRADSISDEILEFLANKNKNYEIWIEYGIQSVFDETLQKINRGENFQTIKNTIIKTKQLGLNVCGHLIFGLPDETQEMMLKSVKTTIALDIDSIKFHPLYVVKKTILTKDYLQGNFKPISKDLYIDTVIKSIKMLPSHISIQRISAGINDESLLAPLWCKCKHTQMQHLKEKLFEHGLIY
jgi:radical SAM protein (TIGR01212 family)